MTIETLGVDIAKNVFQLHGVNRNGHVVLKRRVMRDQLLAVRTVVISPRRSVSSHGSFPAGIARS